LCDTQQRYHREIDALLKEIEESDDEERKADRSERMFLLSREYDKEVDQFQYVLIGALRDLERRLSEARLVQQLRRVFRKRPLGVNPPPVTPDDPRVREFAARRERGTLGPGDA
jgi:hypothetical protein